MQSSTLTLPASRPRWIEKYAKAFEMGFQTALEYRANFLLSLVSAAYPIFIQTFLWTAIYQAGGGATFGFTYRQMIAYTFLAGLTSRIVRTGFEYEIMDDVKSGRFSKFLVQPLGYFPFRLCSFYGEKVPNTIIILILLAGALFLLNLVWGISVDAARVGVYLVSMVLAILLNFLIFYCVSSISFWIVEVGFLFEGVRIVIVLLSGGIFPLEVFGEQFVRLVGLLPFPYTVSYPIKVLNGSVNLSDAWQGLLVQMAWIGLVWGLSNLLWKVGSKRYVAVGG